MIRNLQKDPTRSKYRKPPFPSTFGPLHLQHLRRSRHNGGFPFDALSGECTLLRRPKNLPRGRETLDSALEGGAFSF